jgi:hypothetical protein
MPPAIASAPHPAEVTSPERREVRLWLLAGVLLLALVLRLWGIEWQLPNVLYADELKYVLAASRGGPELDLEPSDFRNPSLFRHLLSVEYRVQRTAGLDELRGPDAVDRALLASHLLLGRLTVALLGTCSVALLYVVGVRVLGPDFGLLASALLAVNLLHVQLSHMSVNDVPAGFLMLAALLPSIGLFERPTRRGFLLAGLLGGLAAATKYNFGVVLVVPLVAWSLRIARRDASSGLLLMGPLLLGLGAVAGFLGGMPETVWAFPDVLEGVMRQSRLGDRPWSGQALDPVLLLYGKTLLQAFGPPAMVAALVGLAVLALRPRPEGLLLILAVSPLAYLAYMSTKALFFARFALPLIPFGCLFAAYGLMSLWASVRAPRPRAALVLVAALSALVPPVLLSARLDQLALQKDTRVEAREWLLANVPTGARLAAQTHSLPYDVGGQDLSRAYDLTLFTLLAEPRRFTQLACAGHSYVLLSSFRWEREQTTGRGGEPTGYELLAQRGRLLVTFSPGPGETEVPLSIDDVGLPFWQVVRYARPGPTIKVYELQPAAC